MAILLVVAWEGIEGEIPHAIGVRGNKVVAVGERAGGGALIPATMH
jgi:hypothetical protein